MNAELLIMFTLDCNRAYLYAHPERVLTGEELHRYEDAVSRRATGVPAQYITGHQEFWGLDFIVTPAVLIPRPETEHVIETILALAKEDGREPALSLPKGRPSLRNLRIVDVGTGSGAIALALAKEFPSAERVVVDGRLIDLGDRLLVLAGGVDELAVREQPVACAVAVASLDLLATE